MEWIRRLGLPKLIHYGSILTGAPILKSTKTHTTVNHHTGIFMSTPQFVMNVLKNT